MEVIEKGVKGRRRDIVGFEMERQRCMSGGDREKRRRQDTVGLEI